ncbi:MAG: tRNA (N6-isopentenyl adenosine(37)-C2)-methylthiotransferase MiaB, partial [Cellulomonadaceae bacterium]|nr:tRNA (N6-isopentenyl adenosine(37)-C2)-methylthiotransferase MiaB [Cellulomonadaceae bacterium]
HIVTERFNRLIELQNRISAQEAAKLVGTEVAVLVAEGEGSKDKATNRISGRAADNRLVHVALPPALAELAATDTRKAFAAGLPRPGDLVIAEVTYGAPHHLIADSALTGGKFEVHRTRAGDAWQGKLLRSR